MLKRNIFYREKIRNPVNEELFFEVSKYYIKDIEKYKTNKLDITNNTMFPYELVERYKKELVIEKNYIYMTLDFSIKFLEDRYEKFRREIYNIINKNEIRKKLNNCVNICNSYFFSQGQHIFSQVKRKANMHFNKTLTLGYDKFYPNQIVAKEIKKQLEKHGIDIRLIKNEFGSNNNNDMNLNLHFIPYMDDEAFYTSFLFKILGNKEYEDIILEYQKTGSINNLIHMANFMNDKAYQIPLFDMNSIYFIKNDIKKFNFHEFNYEIL